MTYSLSFSYLAVWTGLEPATPCVTGRYSNQLNYHTVVLLRRGALLFCVANVALYFEIHNTFKIGTSLCISFKKEKIKNPTGHRIKRNRLETRELSCFYTNKKAVASSSDFCYSFLEYPERDLNPHSRNWPKDFKSFVSTIPPSGRPLLRGQN